MREYYQVFGRMTKPLLKEPVFSNYYHSFESQKKGEMTYIVLETGLVSFLALWYL